MSPYRSPADMPTGPRWHATFWPRLYARFIWPVHRWLGTGEWELREAERRHRAFLVRLDSWKATWGHREVGDDGRPAPTPPCPPPMVLLG